MNYIFKTPLNKLRTKDNVYGEVVYFEEAKQQHIPLICGCKGKDWLCFKCACKLTNFDLFQNEKVEITEIYPVCPLCGRPIYKDSNWEIYDRAKDNLVAVHTICKLRVG
jgi:hypothetical protein